MTNESIVIQGVPIDNLDREESLSRLFAMARAHDEDGRSRMAVIVTADIIMSLHAGTGASAPDGIGTGNKTGGGEVNDETRFTGTSGPDTADRHAFAGMLRTAELMIPVGRPVAWAARILGTGLKKPFSGRSFFERLLEEAVRRGKTVALLQHAKDPSDNSAGSKPESGSGVYRCRFLTGYSPEHAPGQSAGESAGESAGDPPGDSSESLPGKTTPAEKSGRFTPEAPESLTEPVNAAGIDCLVIDIHDPALMRWLAAAKNRLRVPVLLLTGEAGAGGSRWLKKAARQAGLWSEAMEPARSRNFLPGLWLSVKGAYRRHLALGLRILPLAVYQKYAQAAFNIRHQPSMIPAAKNTPHHLPQGITVKIVSMPDPLDASITGDIRERIKQMARSSPKIVLDFSRVHFMDSSGLGLLMSLCRTPSPENREVYLTGIRPRIYNFLKITRTLDFFEDKIKTDIDDVLGTMKTRISESAFTYLAVIRNDTVVFHMYGGLDAAGLMDIHPENLTVPAAGKDVIVNLAGLDFIDSAGVRILVRLNRQAQKGGGVLIACGMRRNVRHLLSIMGADRLFHVEDSPAAAELALRRRRLRRTPREVPRDRHFDETGAAEETKQSIRMR